LGVSSFTEIHFNLSALLIPQDMSSLVAPFEKEEIDLVVKMLPSNKAPGPDGFNTDFTKKCWSIISEDFYKLCNAFYSENICLQSLNGSHITLVPKHDHAIKVSDFRPISLLNTSIKIITKILSNRLQHVMPKLIHKNQYGFIKARSIQDCLAWSLEFLHLCHQSRRELIILKLDFEKAFDTVEHELMVQIMRSKGFPNKWISWMKMIFISGTSTTLLNGIPGKVFHCKRGVRQGDPLSPLLFVLTADFLQTILNTAQQQGLLSLPVVLPHDHDFLILQYADDTLIFMQAGARQLFFLKAILNSFAESTGLRVNYAKSMMVPINVSEDRLHILA
jgi:hypothetical protein